MVQLTQVFCYKCLQPILFLLNPFLKKRTVVLTFILNLLVNNILIDTVKSNCRRNEKNIKNIHGTLRFMVTLKYIYL